jgi:hypothetical protein
MRSAEENSPNRRDRGILRGFPGEGTFKSDCDIDYLCLEEASSMHLVISIQRFMARQNTDGLH